MHRPTQLRGRHHGSAQLADHDTRGDIGQRHRVRHICTGSQRHRQHRYHGIPGAGHIEYLAGSGRQVQLRLTIAQQGHPLFAAGDQQGLQVQIPDQLLALGDQILFILDLPRHSFELAEIGRQQGSATVMTEIGTLGIHQDRDTGLPGQGNQSRAITQGPFGVIGENQSTAMDQLVFHPVGEGRRVLVMEGFLEIQAQQLLLAADHPQLGNRRQAVDFLKVTTHFRRTKPLFQNRSGLIITGNSHQLGTGAQRSHIEGHIGGPAGPVFQLGYPHNRYRRFRRNTPGRAVPVTIEHDIASHKNAGLGKSGNLHRFSKTQQCRTSMQCSIGK